ncbi:hypothetical protein ACMU_14350 [Actibacterium mucosum KCTC 23349]|uniref:Response regulatory domain-containing protein n=1 Tax=Actibacterium mucosum KCTC 23349 TaxID=1454373 RepID=A0A037ZH65_9RHOB|nr:AAA family ATPase [Actibacterium mucosum]KAJ54939.1 hypothetical protein ACMU_14350 [Actibacterium mucosum KCTC 23349]
MTALTKGKHAETGHSVLIVSEDQRFIQDVQGRFFQKNGDAVASEPRGFHGINGRGANLAYAKDVVVFDPHPDDPKEVEALGKLLAKRGADTVFLGLSSDEMSILQARRLRDVGVDEVLPLSISEQELSDVIDDTLASRRRAPFPGATSGAPGSVISVVQARGGIGATTVAVNLACELRNTRRDRRSDMPRVALLDLDIQFGNAGVFLDLEDNGAMRAMVEDRVTPDVPYLHKMVQRHESGVDVISAPAGVIPLSALENDAVAGLMDALAQRYDYVVVDLPRALVDWLEPVIKRTSLLHVVTDLSVPSVRHAKRLIEFYEEVQMGLKVDVIINRENKPMVRMGQWRDAETVLERKFVHWLPDGAKMARKAADMGQPVRKVARLAPLSRALTRLARDTAAAVRESGQEEKLKRG